LFLIHLLLHLEHAEVLGAEYITLVPSKRGSKERPTVTATRTAAADMLLVLYILHPTFLGRLRGNSLFVDKESDFAAKTPVPVIMGFLRPGIAVGMLKPGTKHAMCMMTPS